MVTFISTWEGQLGQAFTSLCHCGKLLTLFCNQVLLSEVSDDTKNPLSSPSSYSLLRFINFVKQFIILASKLFSLLPYRFKGDAILPVIRMRENTWRTLCVYKTPPLCELSRGTLLMCYFNSPYRRQLIA
jgi:hypothetical protein